jgi:hypothetical protein
VTAIGDRVHCKRPNCSSTDCDHEKCLCTSEDSPDLADWNAAHSKRWNHLRTLLRREFPDMEFMRGIEAQDGKRRDDGRGRGALHDHFIARTRGVMDERTIRRLAILAGFGHSVLVAECAPGSKREAYYVAKYVTKTGDERDFVPWRADVVNVETGEVTRCLVKARYRTWSCSRSWGLTMAQVRAEAAVYARAKSWESIAKSEASQMSVLAGAFGALEVVQAVPLPSP